VTSPPPRAAVAVGTRGSALALAQTARVVQLLETAWPGLRAEATPIVTTGDRTQESGEPLPEIGGKGLFTAELEQALREGEIDLAVHSLKDLPTEETPGIVIGAVCLREDARDCLVARGAPGLYHLRTGAAIGTSSLRRSAQLRGMRHDLEIRSIRGNVDTRVSKVRAGELDAVVLAAAGVRRLGLEDAVSEWFSPEAMLPAPGQGALAVQCRAGDEPVLALLAAIEDPATRAETTAERAFLRELGAGCTAPVGAWAEATSPEAASDLSGSEPQGVLHVRLRGLVASVDGREVVRVEGEGEPEEVGARLAREALAAGAHSILEAIRV
jgi:hydroxymethylbilane synthase